ncbi:hypothetical protein AAMO2058_000533400 [Amorphochlora amoebiformis]
MGTLPPAALIWLLVSPFVCTLPNTGNKPRIYVGIPMNWPIKKESTKLNLRALINTWGQRVDILRFYVHEKQLLEYPAKDSGIIEGFEAYIDPIPMERSDRIEERNIWEKMWRGWKLAARKYLNEADWFMKADIDTFLIIDNIRAFLSFLDPKKPHYLGHTLMHEWDKFNLVFNSGIGYILSREVLRRYGQRLNQGMETVGIQEKKYQCYDRGGPLEDPNTAGCLRELGIRPGDTLDKMGRQRFNLFRPRDLLFNMKYIPEDWYWKNKMSIGKKQLGFGCCSNMPLAWHNFKSGKGVFDPEAFEELEYVYGSQNYQSRIKAMELDPPTGNLFQFREDELSFKIDKDGNALLEKHGPDVQIGRWLRDHPETAQCYETGSTCDCKIPELPDGVVHDCGGDVIGHGEKCKGRCGNGYEMIIDSLDIMRKKENKRTQDFFECDGGMLMFPRFYCAKLCVIPESPKGTSFSLSKGSELAHQQTVALRCENSPKTHLLSCLNGRLFGRVSACFGPCVEVKLKLKGSRYTMDQWEYITASVLKGDKFQIIEVEAGGPRDPVGNCPSFGHKKQLLLVTEGPLDSRGQRLVQPLSCGNQEITIIAKERANEVNCPEEFFDT